jgi:hypothetical protein
MLYALLLYYNTAKSPSVPTETSCLLSKIWKNIFFYRKITLTWSVRSYRQHKIQTKLPGSIGLKGIKKVLNNYLMLSHLSYVVQLL